MASCCDNPAAQLKQRVTVQNRSLSADGQGGFTETWADVATVWASIEPYKGWERYQAGQLATPVTHKIAMRFNRVLTTTSRLRYGGRYFDVKEVLNRNEQSRFLDIKAIEIEVAEDATGETSRFQLEDDALFRLEDSSYFLLEAA